MKDDDLLHLLDATIVLSERLGDGRTGNEFIRNLPDTSWDNIPKQRDWRNHVDCAIIAAWSNLGIDAMVSVYIITSQLAEAEEWE